MPAVPFYYYLIPNFQLRLNQRPLATALEDRVVQVQVDEYVDTPAMFSFVIGATEDQAGHIPWLDDPRLFALGHVVDVRMGYDELQSLITGEITALEPEFTAGSMPRMTVRGYDRRHRLQRGSKTRTYLRAKDSDIARQIAGANGLQAQVQDSAVVHDYVMQINQTDWDFLQDRARRIGYEVTVAGKELRFRARPGPAARPLSLVLGAELSEFHPRLSAVQQPTKVIVQGWDVQKKVTVTATAEAGSEALPTVDTRTAGTVVKAAFGEAIASLTIGSANHGEAQALAKAHLSACALQFIQADAVCAGNTALRAGSSVRIEGVGKRFSGVYYVKSASHRYDDAGYSTYLQCLRGHL